MQKCYSVIGLGFGDEGKGTVVDYLCSKHQSDDTVVIRHSGGHQVGHTVRIDDIIHEFRHFGSGTLRGVPTYWSKKCTVSPLGFTLERDLLLMKGIIPTLYVNALCPVTTPLDIAYNRYYNDIILKQKQSTGVGFSSTLIRHETIPLYVKDLKYNEILNHKMDQIVSYYRELVGGANPSWNQDFLSIVEKVNKENRFNFRECCQYFLDNVIILPTGTTFIQKNIIFEGNQGVLLDKDHGFYPYVTHGKTTNFNLNNWDTVSSVDTWYVTRAYCTRHGDGPIATINESVFLINDKDESNHYNDNQGHFRKTPLNIDMIQYAIESDLLDYKRSYKHNLVVSCVDQFENSKEIPYVKNKSLILGDLLQTLRLHTSGQLYFNTSSESKTIQEWKL